MTTRRHRVAGLLIPLVAVAVLAAPAAANVAPFAQNSFERVSWRAGTPLVFDATPSSDPDGRIVLYEWDLDGDGVFERSGATLTKPTHTFTVDRAYIAQLRVTDDGGSTSTQAIEVNIYTVDAIQVLAAPAKLTRKQVLTGFTVEAARNHAALSRDITVSLVCRKAGLLGHGFAFVTADEGFARGTITVKSTWRKEIKATKKLRRAERCQLVFSSDGVHVRRPVRMRR
jgi:PKD repeat protein